MATNQNQLDDVGKAVLRIASEIHKLRSSLPVNHRLQNRLAAMAREITAIAQGVDQK